MKDSDQIFNAENYSNDPTVVVGLHDGRLVEDSTIEISERIISRLQFIGKAYEMHLVPLIDCYEDVGFNSTQCQTLIEELDFIRSTIADKLLAEHILKITALAQTCVTKNNRRIQLYFSGN